MSKYAESGQINGVQVCAHAESLEEHIFLTLTTQDGSVLEIESKFTPGLLTREASSLFTQVLLNMNNDRRDAFSTMLSQHCSRGDDIEYLNRTYWIKEVLIPLADGTPYLEWSGATRLRNVARWSVSLRGMDSVELGSCLWNDETGLSALIASMKDSTRLTAIFALLDPIKSAALTKKIDLANLRKIEKPINLTSNKEADSI